MLNQGNQDLSRVEQLIQTKQVHKAFFRLVQLSNQYSKDEKFLRMLSSVQGQLSDFISREKTLKALMDVNSSAVNVIDYSLQLIKNGKLQLAEAFLTALNFSELSDDLRAICAESLVSIYVQQNNFSGLEKQIHLMEEYQMFNEMFHYGQAILELHFGLEESAIQSLRKAVGLRDHFEQAWVALGLLHEKRGDFELAQANFEKALDFNPLNSVALKFLAQAHIRTGQFERSVDKVSFYLESYSFDEEMTKNYIQLLEMAQKNDVAQREAEKMFYFSGKNLIA